MEPAPVKPRASVGVAIAPPPSLQEPVEVAPLFPAKPPAAPSNFGSSVAAKIMARYGFKEGQGLGKQEQGMASALQVEKTSKRGGRIIHEKEILASATSPVVENPANSQQSITEIIKNPSKVVLLKNMVGPGEVDDDLEPEVKDECNQKYGEVTSVIIHETQAENHEEAVRIFVEFRRIESAIKAVVDLNGRFFGGRQVKANFYDTEKFDNLQLMD
jgi:splicing factor 45